MIRQLVIVSAALMGSTFVVSVQAENTPPVEESKPDFDARQSSRAQSSPGPSAALVENLMVQVQDLQQQVAEQRGLIEELTYQVQVLTEEQKQRYIDLDERILSLQERLNNVSQSATARSASTPEPKTSAVSDEDILAEYNAAREHIRQRNFPEAIKALSEFTTAHPDHALTPNAWYWLGEVQYVSREVDQARQAFAKVINNFPDDAKVPDSLYKLGVIAQQQGNSSDAQRYFERVISEFPDSQSAKLAQARLNSN